MTGNAPIVNVDVIPTDIVSLDLALGVGGLPRGMIVELFGVESSGKTTTTLKLAAACQQCYFEKKKRYGVVAFIDAEHALDLVWAKANGVDVDNLLFNQPSSGEEAFNVIEAFVKSKEVDLVIIDSLAALLPKEELDGDLEDNKIGAQARMISKAIRRLKGPIYDSNTAVVFINQIRNKVGVVFGSPELSPGGMTLKFYSSIRIDMRKGAAIKQSGIKDDERSGNVDSIGMRTKVKIIKNKVARPFRQCEYDIYFGTSPGPGIEPIFGIDSVGSLFDAALENNIIELAGSCYNYGDQRLANGKAKSIAVLHNDAELRQKIRAEGMERCLPLINARTASNDEIINELERDMESDEAAEKRDAELEAGEAIEADGDNLPATNLQLEVDETITSSNLDEVLGEIPPQNED